MTPLELSADCRPQPKVLRAGLTYKGIAGMETAKQLPSNEAPEGVVANVSETGLRNSCRGEKILLFVFEDLGN